MTVPISCPVFSKKNKLKLEIILGTKKVTIGLALLLL
jgi:hypothetical protein